MTANLFEIVKETTIAFRKGEEITEKIEGNLRIVEMFEYPNTSESPTGDNLIKVDMIFIDIVVDKKKAEKYRNDFIEILKKYPQQDRLADGPSYIELAPNLECEQDTALRFMAIGSVLGLWKIVSGKSVGMDETMTRELAGQGFLTISGWKPS